MEQQILLKQMDEWEDREVWIGDKAQSRKYHNAGGGNDEDFDRLWQKLVCDESKKCDNLGFCPTIAELFKSMC